MTEKPNCSNCPLYPCSVEIADSATIVGGLEWQIERLGCLSHPGAREWLMQDVINEYERRLKDGEVVVGLKPAISHIREGGSPSSGMVGNESKG